MSRIVKSLEPFNKKLGTDTWFYAKRCLLSLIETLAKHMMVLPDASFNEVLTFLDAVEIHGKTIKTTIDPYKKLMFQLVSMEILELIAKDGCVRS